MNDITYIVTGDGPRCGSSMMMECLQAGGIRLEFDEDCNNSIKRANWDEPTSNPHGYFEITMENQFNMGFPLALRFSGKAIKVFPPPWGGLLRIIPGNYKIIWMHRKYEDRWNSYFKFHYGAVLDWGQMNNQSFMQYRDARATETLEIMKLRSDCDVIEMQYDRILQTPQEAFEFLAADNYPIDPKLSASIVNSNMQHFKKAV